MSLKDGPRYGWCKRSEKGANRRIQKWEKDLGEIPAYLPNRLLRTGWKEGGGISTKPLFRYLNQMIGKPWSEVLSGIPLDLRPELDWILDRGVVETEDGRFFSHGGFTGFFIKEGIFNRFQEKHKKWKRQVLPKNVSLFEERYENHYHWQVKHESKIYIKRDEFWFEAVPQTTQIGKWDEENKKWYSVPVTTNRWLQVKGKLQKALEKYIVGLKLPTRWR